MNAVTATEPAAEVAAPLGTANILDAVLKVANDPSVDIDRFERLMGMYERLRAQHAKMMFTEALNELQPKLPVIDENGGIKNNSGVVQSTYATYEDISDAVMPLVHEHGFTLSYRPGLDAGGKVTVTAILRHREGHEDEATVTLPHDSSGNKNTVQAVGSSLSYGKRYALIALLNITSRAKADRDDDGRGAGLSDIAQRALSDINMSETLDDLRAWKSKTFDGLTKVLDAGELREVIALYNRRIKAVKAVANG